MSEKIKYSQKLVGISLRKILEFYNELYKKLKEKIKYDWILKVTSSTGPVKIGDEIDGLFKLSDGRSIEVISSGWKTGDKKGTTRNKDEKKEYEKNRKETADGLCEKVSQLIKMFTDMKEDYAVYKEIAKEYEKQKIGKVKASLDSSSSKLEDDFAINVRISNEDKENSLKLVDNLSKIKNQINTLLAVWKENESDIKKSHKHLKSIAKVKK